MMRSKIKVALAAAALLFAILFLAVRLNTIPLGGPKLPSVRGAEDGGVVAAKVDPQIAAALAPDEVAYVDKEGKTIVIARPSTSRASARASGLDENGSRAPAMIQYLLKGPASHGYTQVDAEWFLNILREHEDADAKKVALWGMGFALGPDDSSVPAPTFDATHRASMEAAILSSFVHPEATVRRAAMAATLSAQLDQRPEYAASLKELLHDPDPNIVHSIQYRLDELARTRAKDQAK